jgi:ribonucleotide monophosphatase NagD (HAD superfamily)
MVTAVATATGARPQTVGKPQPTLFRAAADRAAADRVAAGRPLVVGDRIDTDIAGATAAGLDSLLVLTGVSTADDLVAAAPGQRPTYVGRDLRALAGPPVPIAAEAEAGDGLDDLRARCRRAWAV